MVLGYNLVDGLGITSNEESTWTVTLVNPCTLSTFSTLAALNLMTTSVLAPAPTY
jgi:hypothetical protein